jgi:small subunit ribosomal protein S16
VSVRIRMKHLGRKHRPYFRICAMEIRTPRNGRVLEELGTYDPMIPDTDARAVLNGERVDFWISKGAQPSENVTVLIKKYGTGGTHLEKQKVALDRLAQSRRRPEPIQPPPKAPRRTKAEAASAAAEEAAAETAVAPPAAEAPPAEPPAEGS